MGKRTADKDGDIDRERSSRDTSDESDCKETSEFSEKEEDVDIRMYAAISFVFLLLVVGIPLWWKTTEVYRVHVPYGRIDDLKEADVVFPAHVTILSKETERVNSLLKHLSSALSNTGNGIINVDFKGRSDFDVNKVLTAESLQALDEMDLFPNEVSHIYLLEVPGMLRFTAKDVIVGRKRVVYFSTQAKPETLHAVLSQWIIRADALFRTKAIIEAPNEWSRDRTGGRRMPPAAQYDIMFSMVHPEPEKRNIKWNIKEAIRDHLGGLLEYLSPIITFHIKSQWLYSVRLEGRPRQVQEEAQTWYSLSEDILPHIITPLEKKLGSGVSEHPTIQLVLYIPPCQISPLFITSSRSSIQPSLAFLSPRWGGVQIFNPPQSLCGHVDENSSWLDSEAIMNTFKMQLKLLVGFPELEKIGGVEQLPLPASGVRDWELDSLMRIKATEHLISARITLKSLAQLLDEISNIVINDEVGDKIWEAILKSHEAINYIQDYDLTNGYNLSKQAFLAAETAFSDPSLLALLYFPEDQKYAVYIPLFLPVMIPVLMSLRGIRSWWFSGSEDTSEAKKKTE
ncbi:GPI transamidase component PIG-S isoform X2 [Thrips palmi]|uniref:GPI transamidase component PIG-S isoform X2 n=1 Tax=Thrips palmi TaxID=161013 RepID=A0A6P9AAM9_THRPL|nr:GPI transamidase component PIG-S isoform X2 [Thrips palmi]